MLPDSGYFITGKDGTLESELALFGGAVGKLENGVALPKTRKK